MQRRRRSDPRCAGIVSSAHPQPPWDFSRGVASFPLLRRLSCFRHTGRRGRIQAIRSPGRSAPRTPSRSCRPSYPSGRPSTSPCKRRGAKRPRRRRTRVDPKRVATPATEIRSRSASGSVRDSGPAAVASPSGWIRPRGRRRWAFGTSRGIRRWTSVSCPIPTSASTGCTWRGGTRRRSGGAPGSGPAARTRGACPTGGTRGGGSTGTTRTRAPAIILPRLRDLRVLRLL
mmetsp:Transcript_35037/g.104496  ORF Transcript_35037/g.104496 Transcript_35037/m.104496 type:complete len:230 (-) Transcript_35037:234-923(-)